MPPDWVAARTRGILRLPMTATPAPIPEATTPAVAMTTAVCPYLLSADGAWRASTAARDHRCTAVAPPAQVAAEKQQRLCLRATHTGCATYRAAMSGGDPSGEAAAWRVPLERPASRPIARTTPMVLDHGRVRLAVPALRGEPRLGQLVLLGLMGLAFAAILLARLPAGLGPADGAGAGGAGPSPASSLPVTALPSRTPKPAASPGAASPAPARTLVPTEAKPSATPAATAGASAAPTTYKVKRGDTLSAIALKFGTTWQVLAEINHISDPGRLRVGQVLELP